MLDDDHLARIADALLEVPGVCGVALGGSRARGTHTPDSDVDLGLYHEGPLDVQALASRAREYGGEHAEVTVPGGWGPWVDGGGWLTIDGMPVDWIYRDVQRVEASVAAAQRGDITRHYQLGHPFGVPEYGYAAEIALGAVIADPARRLAALKDSLTPYPPALSAALVRALADADFTLALARKGASRGDAVYVSGCLFQALLIGANAIHGAAGSWVTNEKGAVALAASLPAAPDRFAERAARIAGDLGQTSAELARTINEAEALLADTRDRIAARPR